MDRPNSLSDGLVAYYPFDGTVEDKSGFGHHGSEPGEFVFVRNTAFIGQSLSCFAYRCVVVTNAPTLQLEQFTLTGWIWLRGQPQSARIVEKGQFDSYYLTLNGLGWPVFGFTDSSMTQNASPRVNMADSRWRFVAGTYDGGVFQVYLDGSLAATKPATGRPLRTSSELLIGSQNPAEDYILLFDEVRIYRRALAASEIRELYEMNLAASTEWRSRH
jgi:hypothetical protein